MASFRLETDRIFLRTFKQEDQEALYLLLQDEEVNTFLPWFPVRSLEETADFFQRRIQGRDYYLAVCLKGTDFPIGYAAVDSGEAHDLGYALRREFWGRGIAVEAADALVNQLRADGVAYVTATHDRNNPASGGVMRRIGMKYCYTYEEQWQPKNIPVLFRMYQLNLDGREDRVYQAYWERSKHHFIERDI